MQGVQGVQVDPSVADAEGGVGGVGEVGGGGLQRLQRLQRGLQLTSRRRARPKNLSFASQKRSVKALYVRQAGWVGQTHCSSVNSSTGRLSAGVPALGGTFGLGLLQVRFGLGLAPGSGPGWTLGWERAWDSLSAGAPVSTTQRRAAASTGSSSLERCASFDLR